MAIPSIGFQSSLKDQSSIRIHPSTIQRFGRIRGALLTWYRHNKQPYAWRALRRDPYTILVSEFMLQQTGARHVEQKLAEFLRLFPTVRLLASADSATVVRAWQGLGYNRRALNLHKTARIIAARGRRPFPNTFEQLIVLPGVGEYTASAVLSFAFGRDVAVVDVNVHRVLSRLLKPMADYSATLPIDEIAALDLKILPQGESGLWHEALMDFGSTICTKRNPKCESCPLLRSCSSSKRFIRLERHELIGAQPNIERKYYGQPNRIWRGRVLKEIAACSGVGFSTMTKNLEVQYKLPDADSAGFVTFVSAIASRLIEEGFVSRRGKILSLSK